MTKRPQQAQELIATVLSQGGGAAVTSSFQHECVALVHMIVQQAPDIPVLFLETGYHFPETLAYRDKIARGVEAEPPQSRSPAERRRQEAQFGILNQTAPDQCCKLRKVGPLFAGLADYDVWFTALRREQSPTRANLQEVEPFKLPSGKVLQKISPLAVGPCRKSGAISIATASKKLLRSKRARPRQVMARAEKVEATTRRVSLRRNDRLGKNMELSLPAIADNGLGEEQEP